MILLGGGGAAVDGCWRNSNRFYHGTFCCCRCLLFSRLRLVFSFRLFRHFLSHPTMLCSQWSLARWLTKKPTKKFCVKSRFIFCCWDHLPLFADGNNSGFSSVVEKVSCGNLWVWLICGVWWAWWHVKLIRLRCWTAFHVLLEFGLVMMIETDWNPIRQIQLSRYLPLSLNAFCVFIVFALVGRPHTLDGKLFIASTSDDRPSSIYRPPQKTIISSRWK